MSMRVHGEPCSYSVGQWNGRDNYQCNECPFATLNEAEMLDHIIARHTPPPPPRPRALGGGLILVADKSGREVQPASPALVDELAWTPEEFLAALSESPQQTECAAGYCRKE